MPKSKYPLLPHHFVSRVSYNNLFARTTFAFWILP
jgi:hypothetical protein